MSAAAIPFALSSSSTKRDEIAQGTKEQVTSCVRKHHDGESRPSGVKSADNTGDKWHYLGSPKSSVNQVDDQRSNGLPITGTLTVLAIVRDGAWHELEDNSCRQG